MLAVEAASAAHDPAAQTPIDDAKQWLRSRGIDQWQDPVPDAVLLRDAEQRILFVVREEQVIVAMGTVSDSDAETWGMEGSSAGYVRWWPWRRRIVAADSGNDDCSRQG